MFSFFRPDIAKMREGKDVDALIKALKHRDISIRMNAAYALGDVGDRKAVEPLIGILKDPTEGWGMKMAVATALGELHDERAIEPLEALATRGETLEADAATIAIAIIRGDPPRLIELLEAKKGELASRVSAIKELGKLGDERAVEPLIRMLNQKNYDEYERVNICYQAIIALGNLGDARAIEPVSKYLNDNAKEVRKAAEEALEKIKAQGGPLPPPPPPPT
jgi:HEAT repeat protein